MEYVSIQMSSDGLIHLEKIDKNSFLHDFYFGCTNSGEHYRGVKCLNDENDIEKWKKKLINHVLKDLVEERKVLNSKIKAVKQNLVV